MFIAYFKNLIIFSTLVLWARPVAKCIQYVNKRFYRKIQFRDLLPCHSQFRAGLPITSLLNLCEWELWVPRPDVSVFPGPIITREGCASGLLIQIPSQLRNVLEPSEKPLGKAMVR